MLCYLRYPGRPLRAGERPPAVLTAFVAEQIDALPTAMEAYLAAERNRQRHAVELVGRSLIIKPHIGGMGRSEHIRHVRSETDLYSIDLRCDTYVVQTFVSGPDQDLKIYVAGDSYFGVRKRFEPSNLNNTGEPCPVSGEIKSIAQRVGEALGLGLFGIDIIEAEAGPMVVDVNYFPSYYAIEAAPAAIADYIDGFARGVIVLKGCLTSPMPAYSPQQREPGVIRC
jgi:glutathione synthase/RimK-type ligase-like ATP-grasp enzyme